MARRKVRRKNTRGGREEINEIATEQKFEGGKRHYEGKSEERPRPQGGGGNTVRRWLK